MLVKRGLVMRNFHPEVKAILSAFCAVFLVLFLAAIVLLFVFSCVSVWYWDSGFMLKAFSVPVGDWHGAIRLLAFLFFLFLTFVFVGIWIETRDHYLCEEGG